MTYRTRWTILITIGGLATVAVIWAITDNIWWGIVGLPAFGMVFNAIFNRGSRSAQ